MHGRRATERAVDAIRVVIVFVFLQLARQVHGFPEKYPIKVLTPAQKDGFNAEEIDTPDAVLRVSDECQPGRTSPGGADRA